MPFQIIRNDLVKMEVDAIVNTTNPSPKVGYGVDMGIHQAAGPRLLLARKLLGTLPIGGAGITKGYRLPAKHVIHTVCPVWESGDKGEVQLLTKAYSSCLQLAAEKGCQSIAFPLMSAGNHGFPKEIALKTAMDAITDFLLHHEMMVYLVVFSQNAVKLSEQLVSSVESFIDENYMREKKLQEYGYGDKCDVRYEQVRETLEHQRRGYILEEDTSVLRESSAPQEPDGGMFAPAPAPRKSPVKARPSSASAAAPARGKTPSKPIRTSELANLLAKTDDTFSATLLKFIDRTRQKDSEVYRRANISRQTFSKIRSGQIPTPSKPTILAFAIALELDLEDTKLLLSRAGHALTHANKQDIVVEYFIEQHNYDIHELNSVLFYFDLPLLGNIDR